MTLIDILQCDSPPLETAPITVGLFLDMAAIHGSGDNMVGLALVSPLLPWEKQLIKKDLFWNDFVHLIELALTSIATAFFSILKAIKWRYLLVVKLMLSFRKIHEQRSWRHFEY